MTSSENPIQVVDVDQVFPLLTNGAVPAGTTSRARSDQTPSVRAVLRDVLGWLPRAQDSKAFTAALTASFALSESEGHTVATYVPRGLAIAADLGVVSGGQASLYSRAGAALDQIGQLLDGLKPLRADADLDDCNSFVLLVRHGISRLVGEMGNPGGPRQPLVDGAFDMLAGGLIGSSASARRTALARVSADNVVGQLGALRSRFGLSDANVNSVDEETVRTAFWTLVDHVMDLRRSWEEWKSVASASSGSGFLGTDLVLINRLMAAAAEQVDDFESILDSVLVNAAQRQTLALGTTGDGLTLDGLLSWLRVFLTEDGPMYARDSGRDGMRTAFAPTADQLLTAVQHNLVSPINATLSALPRVRPTVSLIPASCRDDLPPGMYSARVRVAVAGLCRMLCKLFTAASRISRYPGVVLFDAEFQPLDNATVDAHQVYRVSIRGANLRATYLPAFVVGDATTYVTIRPLNDSVTADADTLVGLFASKEVTAFVDSVNNTASLTRAKQRSSPVVPPSFAVPAQTLPLLIIDGETGTAISSPATTSWPSLKALGAGQLATSDVDWDGLPSDSSFDSGFEGATPGEEQSNISGTLASPPPGVPPAAP